MLVLTGQKQRKCQMQGKEEIGRPESVDGGSRSLSSRFAAHLTTFEHGAGRPVAIPCGRERVSSALLIKAYASILHILIVPDPTQSASPFENCGNKPRFAADASAQTEQLYAG